MILGLPLFKLFLICNKIETKINRWAIYISMATNDDLRRYERQICDPNNNASLSKKLIALRLLYMIWSKPVRVVPAITEPPQPPSELPG